MNKITARVRAMHPVQRRRFLGVLGAALAAPFVPAALRLAAHELALGEAQAQEMPEPTLFLEFNFRDQVDLMHVMVPPSIATYPNRRVGVNGNQLTMFAPQGELQALPNGVFLTNDSLELTPHIDSVAMLDTGEPGIGNVHGHEAMNGMRSPGRVMDRGLTGLNPMWLNDGQHAAGSEELYGRAPTPASFHNYQQKRLSPNLRNGFAFKGISRAKHSVYHYGADLPGAELDRIPGKAELLATFEADFQPSAEQAELVQAILSQVAPPYRKSSGAGYDELMQHFRTLQARQVQQLDLTPEEIARWSAGVPPQQCTIGDYDVITCSEEPGATEGTVKAQIWEQFAYASKLLRSGTVRSIALEFDFMDLAGDGVRTELVLRTQAQQVARPLARLITDLKAAGLYERSLIAVYTLDGSRSPAANSYGDNGKGTVVLAGGRVRGGYYGDIQITSDLAAGGHSYGFRPPDPATGAPLPTVTAWNDRAKRTPSGSVWRTVMKALGIPASEYVGKFMPQIDAAVPLDFMLKA